MSNYKRFSFHLFVHEISHRYDGNIFKLLSRSDFARAQYNVFVNFKPLFIMHLNLPYKLLCLLIKTA